MFTDATIPEINAAMERAWTAFASYRVVSAKQRADFMRVIANDLEKNEEVIALAADETNLPIARLQNEKARTVFQLRSYADDCEKATWMDIRIDTALPERTPSRPDIRKTQVPLGPVVVFGASNFPFAYSTAGGDTACAFAAGCPVVVKAHPAHARTSEAVARLITGAAMACKMPDGIFSHIHGASFEVGKALVTHPYTKAVGFTGSYAGGKQLFDWGAQRSEPIPIFAEMGSVNPVFLFPGKLKAEAKETAKLYAGSITLGVGQFCTKPGLIVGIDGEELQIFITALAAEIAAILPGKMLHKGIAKAYAEKREKALSQPDVATVAVSSAPTTIEETYRGVPTIASASGQAFLKNPVLHQEVFGPYSIVIRCAGASEMQEVITHLEGQLTASVMATSDDAREHQALIESIKQFCGRLIFNGVPTGVEVCLSMQHGGPFPATTDSRFTSVGADGIKRFARPLSYQNWPNDLLPDELKNENPLGIWRTVDNEPCNGQV